MTRIKIDGFNDYQYYFPVNIGQVRNLVGAMLTHIEALNLPEKAEKANKDLVQQAIYRWWDFAQENSLTSWEGCLGPIKVSGDANVPNGTDTPDNTYAWFTNVGIVKNTKYASEK